jgi:cytochrome c oxidase subunit II
MSFPRASAGIAAAGIAALFGGCRSPLSTLDPAGPQASAIAGTWWIMLALALVVYAGVLAALFYAIYRPRRGGDGQDRSASRFAGTALIAGGGILVPLAILPIVWWVTLSTMATLSAPPRTPALTVEVVAHQWWYEVRYPDHQVALVDELRLPAGTPVLVRVTSADVIHSFWIPRLAGKLDMIPGKVNELWLEAAQPGEYLGQCGEFCGLMHAVMRLRVVVEPEDQFAAWLAANRRAGM